MDKFSYMNQADPEYFEELYRTYRDDPDSLDEEWKRFFDGFEFAGSTDGKAAQSPEAVQKEIKVLNLIHAYRTRGHLFTKTNPVRTRRQYSPTLDLENFGLSDKDLDTVFHAGSEIGIGSAPLRKIVEHLSRTYCSSIGAEYMFIRMPERVQWLKERMESTQNQPDFSSGEKRRILHKLNHAVVFENFLNTKYVGQKRFSLSGGETLIPGLDAIVEHGAEMGVEEIMLGMPHRGRLNVLADILRKSYQEIFSEFEGQEYAEGVFSGDVKYHLGYNSIVETQTGKKVKVGIAPNPSHLESVDPVVEGMVRSKIDSKYGGDIKKIIPVLIHGDASIAGQGVVYEVIQMSLLNSYKTGGTIHIVVNNQLGFTTNYLEGRSSTYCTDVAKVTLSPVFHVNSDDAEAVVFAILMALEYRQTFHTDVFIDLLGYRKYGHNEADEPRFTQPKLYEIIAQHPDARKIYYNKLLQQGEVEKGIADEMEKDFRQMLQRRFDQAKKITVFKDSSGIKDDCDLLKRVSFDAKQEMSIDTAVEEKELLRIGEKVLTIPEDLKVFDKIRRLYNSQKKKLMEDKTGDWALAEFLAYGSLLEERIPIRLSGQDTARGTFSHRHSVLYVEDTEEKYTPLNHISDRQAHISINNSLLSEYAAMGFEFGYSCARPEGLTIWEAQFGDFANGAQIIIDQYIASSEAKWKRMNGLVLYLPHGYEGQGAEHSSARIERYLELCANNNLQVIYPTTPANLFHLLRRHVKLPFRVPMIVFTPKSLLRHPLCVSPVKDFSSGRFQEVIDDTEVKAKDVKTVLLCSGKLYYELYEKQQADKRKDIAIVRLEQLYPVPQKALQKMAKKYKSADRFVWVQEEPENMGAWGFLKRKWNEVELQLVSRPESATPATGFHKQHHQEQDELIENAFKFKTK